MRDERGQSLILFVLSFTALMGLLALVVNVGYWYQKQRQLQTVADATALQAGQSDHDTFANIAADAPQAATNMANTNWPGSVLTQYLFDAGGSGEPFRAPDKTWLSIQVETQHNVGYLLQNMLNFLGVDIHPLTFKATARVRIDSPVGLDQVAPIAIRCDDPNDPSTVPCQRPWPGWNSSIFAAKRDWPLDPLSTSDPSDDTPIDFTYYPKNDVDHLPHSTLMPLEQFPGATPLDIRNELASCNPSVKNSCGMDIASTPTTLPHLVPPSDSDTDIKDFADLFRFALQDAGHWNQLVAVYEGPPVQNAPLNIIGFAAVDIVNVDDNGGAGGGPVTISVRFHKMFYDSAQLVHPQDANTHGDYDFGVRTISLSG